jgi:glycosyltransferase involved in cell wall biosynthesis
MASGTPAIGARAASIPEVMGEGGMLFDPRSADELKNVLQRVLEDSPLRAQMIKDGLRNAARFSWRTCAEQTLQIYREVV